MHPNEDLISGFYSAFASGDHDGKIVRHRDDFDLYAWARMALGPLGILLGWTGNV